VRELISKLFGDLKDPPHSLIVDLMRISFFIFLYNAVEIVDAEIMETDLNSVPFWRSSLMAAIKKDKQLYLKMSIS
jgi:hypothetical protein